MPRTQFTGRGDLRFVPTVTTLAAPTAAQIIAGTRLTPLNLRDGLTRPQSGETMDIADAASRFNKRAAGTFGGDAMELTFHRDSKASSDIAWSTLAPQTSGYIVVTDWGWAQSGTTGLGTTSGTPTAGDRCEVYPVEVISREPTPNADNENRRFVARLAITDDPALDAVVA